jgi:hypothetical protein
MEVAILSWGDMKNLNKKNRSREDKHHEIMNKSVKIIDKDSVECTPPSEITVRHGMNKLYISGKVDPKCKLR